MPAPTEKTSRSEELTAQSQLVRTVEANLDIAVIESDHEIRFRDSLLRCASAQIAKMPPGLLTRLYEAACKVRFSTPAVVLFRESLQVEIGTRLSLKSYRR